MKLLLFCLTAPALWAGAPSQGDVRSAAARAIAMIERGSNGFYKAQGCSACHALALPAMAIRIARERGIPVDEAALHANAVKALSNLPNLASLDSAVQNNTIIDPAGEGFAAMAADPLGIRPNTALGVRAKLLANWQREDGSWRTGDNRPPQSHSTFTATAVSVFMMTRYLPETMREEASKGAARARQWLLKTPPRTNEDYTFKLFGLAWSGGTEQERAAAANDLLSLQRANGGWAQLPRMEPDAYATGQALVALQQAGGIPVTDPRWQKGVRFLQSTQAPDGSWLVRTRMVSPAQVSPPYFETGFPYGKDQIISTMGTCWAVMAEMLTLPKTDRPALPKPFPEFLDRDVTPWMRTALFGTASELKTLLDAGLDPNSKTEKGTTLLMMAAPDLGKMKLLVERGADVRAKAKSGFTALMVASSFRGDYEALELLLTNGAEAAPGTGVMFNASPLVMASLASDARNVSLLLSKGADPSRKMVLLGFFPSSALFAAIGFGDVDTIHALIAGGADVRETDPDGMNLLHWTVLANHVPAVQELIRAGVPLNQTDKYGYTPLMYAATVDFGGADMVAALLDAGADPDVKSKDGKTALASARTLGYTYIASALENARRRDR